MQTRLTIAVVIAFAFLIPAIAWSVGADHPSHPITNDQWPEGLAELVNRDNRVHGYFVNFEDILFFQGDTTALNAFLEQYAKLANTRLKVVIHPGKLEVKSPWDDEPRNISADWRLYASPFTRDQLQAGRLKPGPFVTCVDVWLGGSVNLKELRVPKNVLVESGGEIEAFVETHRASE